MMTKNWRIPLIVIMGLLTGPTQLEATGTSPTVGFSLEDSVRVALASSEGRENDHKGNPLKSGPLRDLNQLENLDRITRIFSLSERGKSLLLRNGFLVLDEAFRSDMIAVYGRLKREGIPIFVTSDSVLHLFHIQFVQALMDIEKKYLIPLLRELSRAMMVHFQKLFETTSGVLKKASKKNASFFAVGLRLQEPKALIHESISKDVSGEIQNISGHRGFMRSHIFGYREDFSQYVPRGYYNQDEDLKNYFKAMMWYGRMAFLLKGGLISDEDARVQTLQACLIASALPRIKIGERTVSEIWEGLYAITSFFIGWADDLTPLDYRRAMEEAGIEASPIESIENEATLLEVRARLVNLDRPEIFGGTGICMIQPPATKEKVEKCLDETQGMRFMGQRFIPDSYAFQRLVNLSYTSNNTPFTMVRLYDTAIRGFPRGLDLMALLGSNRAIQILKLEGDTDYEGYDQEFNHLKKEFESIEICHWTKSLYWNWLYCLNPLLTKAYEQGHPSFMRTSAWKDKQLHTALASWAQLRHDTLLYAKPSYTPTAAMPPEIEPPTGYVEPLPEFYDRLNTLTSKLEKKMRSWGFLEDSLMKRLEMMSAVLKKLARISRLQLKGEALSKKDSRFIKDFGNFLEAMTGDIAEKGKKTLTIADVHTDLNSGEVLEEGVGYTNTLLVVLERPDGRFFLGAGPIFSYYEFKWPMTDRMTDAKWEEMLSLGRGPEPPQWTTSFME